MIVGFAAAEYSIIAFGNKEIFQQVEDIQSTKNDSTNANIRN